MNWELADSVAPYIILVAVFMLISWGGRIASKTEI
jgi:hypothetical protein